MSVIRKNAGGVHGIYTVILVYVGTALLRYGKGTCTAGRNAGIVAEDSRSVHSVNAVVSVDISLTAHRRGSVLRKDRICVSEVVGIIFGEGQTVVVLRDMFHVEGAVEIIASL